MDELEWDNDAGDCVIRTYKYGRNLPEMNEDTTINRYTFFTFYSIPDKEWVTIVKERRDIKGMGSSAAGSMCRCLWMLEANL